MIFLQKEKELTEKIVEEVIETLKQYMRNLDIEFSENTDEIGILLEYYNYKEKRISSTPREVIISKELKQKIENKNLTEEIIELINHFKILFEKGKDLNNHLSKQIFSGKRKDILYNQWNIKHIHLNKIEANTKNEMSNNRGDFLLFCIVLQDKILFLDVRQHPHKEEFTAFSFLEIAYNNNWMNHIGFLENKKIQNVELEI